MVQTRRTRLGTGNSARSTPLSDLQVEILSAELLSPPLPPMPPLALASPPLPPSIVNVNPRGLQFPAELWLDIFAQQDYKTLTSILPYVCRNFYHLIGRPNFTSRMPLDTILLREYPLDEPPPPPEALTLHPFLSKGFKIKTTLEKDPQATARPNHPQLNLPQPNNLQPNIPQLAVPQLNVNQLNVPQLNVPQPNIIQLNITQNNVLRPNTPVDFREQTIIHGDEHWNPDDDSFLIERKFEMYMRNSVAKAFYENATSPAIRHLSVDSYDVAWRRDGGRRSSSVDQRKVQMFECLSERRGVSVIDVLVARLVAVYLLKAGRRVDDEGKGGGGGRNCLHDAAMWLESRIRGRVYRRRLRYPGEYQGRDVEEEFRRLREMFNRYGARVSMIQPDEE